MPNTKGRGEMTVREAGKMGGQKGGEATARTHGHDFYQEIGHKGGQKVRELVKKGEQSEGQNEEEI
ncbi:TPA: Em GEA1 (EM1) [Candidatus Berkelbacteria bacterium]|uniref:Putative small hydrophilic plant seed protein n=1 Tax=Berkelbacteria bacterium GW2011_GWE1_39_12 TaxID=1618337 RepID=A0A0G4B338_9BACT|nr:MAG: putative small hydrophilic plant seed protein [Berkelbacteria bacterium GW2011_GWE1_39_12]HBO60612.1 Em GEA1 (EM1) [Candidatus Berkelbacteria bacterium]